LIHFKLQDIKKSDFQFVRQDKIIC